MDPDVPIEDVAGTVKELIERARSGTSACPKPACRRSVARTLSSRDGAAERVLAVVAGAGEGNPAHARGAGHRLRAVQPAGQGISHRQIDENTKFDSTDFRNIVPRFTEENRKANQAFVDWLRLRRRKRVTPAQIAIAWLIAQKPWIVPIPGTTKRHRLEENLGAAIDRAHQGRLREIDRAASYIEVHGALNPEHLQKMVGR